MIASPAAVEAFPAKTLPRPSPLPFIAEMRCRCSVSKGKKRTTTLIRNRNGFSLLSSVVIRVYGVRSVVRFSGASSSITRVPGLVLCIFFSVRARRPSLSKVWASRKQRTASQRPLHDVCRAVYRVILKRNVLHSEFIVIFVRCTFAVQRRPLCILTV